MDGERSSGAGPWPPQGRRGDGGALRRALLAVSVLDDVDLVPADEGVHLLAGGDPHLVPWERLAAVVGDAPVEGPVARVRLRAWLRVRAAVLAGAPAERTRAVRPLALPPGSVLHPGAAWVVERVPGGALDVGLGLLVPGADDDGVLPLWPDAAGLGPRSTATAWRAARTRLEAMGELAASRLERARIAARATAGAPPLDGPVAPAAVLEPTGGCDSLTLLASAPLRRWLAESDGTGLRAVAAPTRSRAWFDTARIDPDFVAAAWTATEPGQRGLDRPLLVTADEVVAAPRWAR